MKKIRLINDWRNYWRFWSVQLGVLGSTIVTWLIAFPEHLLFVWNMLPPDLKLYFPAQYMPLIGVGVFILSLIARIVKQKKLENE